jgi:hypothetical protein
MWIGTSLVFVFLVLLFHYHGQLHPSQVRGVSKATRDSLQGVQGENAGDHGGNHGVTGSRFADHHAVQSQKERDVEDMALRNGENGVGIVEHKHDRRSDNEWGSGDTDHEDEDDFYFGAFFYKVSAFQAHHVH